MEITETDKYCLITPLSNKLNERETIKIIKEAESKQTKTALDMSFVNDCTIEFIEGIKNLKNISLFNVQSDIFALLLSMNIDKFVNLFVTESDFLQNKRSLLNRKFNVFYNSTP